jgi:hypothetical protein
MDVKLTNVEKVEERKISADNFLKFDYVETKDLCKQFLALVASLLVFSVTFSEKIVDFDHAPLVPKLLLVGSWFSFLVAIIATGGALYVLFNAGMLATHRPEKGEWRLRMRFISFQLLNVAGVSFVLGLLVLIGSGLYRFHG